MSTWDDEEPRELNVDTKRVGWAAIAALIGAAIAGWFARRVGLISL